MNRMSLAPCGVLCDLCIGFQREKNRCEGCHSTGKKPYHCTVCKIKECPEKVGNETALCSDCGQFPCKRIKNLDKRYTSRYGESPIQNLRNVNDLGIEVFIQVETDRWTCRQCGTLLCAHRESCLNCGTKNDYFLVKK